MNVPAPVYLAVNEVDVEEMRTDYLRHSHGVPRPWMLGIGICFLIEALVDALRQSPSWWWTTVFGVTLLFMSTRAGKGFPPAVRPTGVRFTSQGLDFDVAFEQHPRRHYSWREIRAFDDIGEGFVLVPKFGKRVVLPKRCFDDGGREASAFVLAHGVHGRSPQRGPVPA